ncbi:MAG: 30S ribosome-binding factor RbfA [Bacilli bacterium]
MAYKRERLEKILEREIATIISNDVKDDRLKFVTITNVNLTNDLSIATVYYTVLGDQNQVIATGENINEAKGFIKGLLSKRLEVRKTPDLRFKFDDSFEQGNRIESILKNIKNKGE